MVSQYIFNFVSINTNSQYNQFLPTHPLLEVLVYSTEAIL